MSSRPGGNTRFQFKTGGLTFRNTPPAGSRAFFVDGSGHPAQS
jgi:hypothetical protein